MLELDGKVESRGLVVVALNIVFNTLWFILTAKPWQHVKYGRQTKFHALEQINDLETTFDLHQEFKAFLNLLETC